MKVKVEVEIPDGEYCWHYDRDTRCQFWSGEYDIYCCLLPDASLASDEDGDYKKHKDCPSLTKE